MFISKLIHRIYDGMLKISAGRYALWALFGVAFAESSFFPIPPDVMLIPMILATPKKAWKIAGLATLASVLGGTFGYLIGSCFFDWIARPLLEFYQATEQFSAFEESYRHYGAWIVFFAGITPFPYKIITIASGAVRLNPVIFTVASILARGIRFYLIAWLLKKYGEPMKAFIERHLGWFSVLFCLLLIGGFLLIKYL